MEWDLVRVSGKFELSHLELVWFYCSLISYLKPPGVLKRPNYISFVLGKNFNGWTRWTNEDSMNNMTVKCFEKGQCIKVWLIESSSPQYNHVLSGLNLKSYFLVTIILSRTVRLVKQMNNILSEVLWKKGSVYWVWLAESSSPQYNHVLSGLNLKSSFLVTIILSRNLKWNFLKEGNSSLEYHHMVWKWENKLKWFVWGTFSLLAIN